MQRHHDSVQDRHGNAVPNATVTVRTEAGALATIYSDDGITTQNNPLSVATDGEYNFYAANGRYTLTVTAAGYGSDTKTDVLLYDPADSAVGMVTDAVTRVETVAALRALAAPTLKTVIYLEGYYAAGDGGGSALVWMPTSTNADNGGTVFRPSSNPTNGRWERSADRVPVKWFGAVGDGVADDYAKCNDALTYLKSIGGGTLWFHDGTYRLTATLVGTTTSIYFEGASAVGTILVADHLAGPVLQVGHYFCGISKMTLDSSASRLAGGVGTGAGNCGILDINPDTAGVQSIHSEIDQVHVRDQPGHGIVLVNYWKGTEVVRCRITDVGGHGVYVIDATGLGLSYTNEGRAGGVTVRDSLIYRCTGHAIATGDYPSGFSTYRLWIDNCDISYCALTAGVRRSAHALHIYSQNALITRCGIGGFTTVPAATVGGIFINGRSPQVINNRFLDVLGEIVELGPDADGARILDNQIDGVVQVALDPAVKVASTCLGVTVEQGELTFVTSLMTPAPNNSGNRAVVQGLTPQGFKSARGEVTVADDAVATINLSGIVRGILVFSANSNAGKSSIHWFRVGDANAFVAQLTAITNITGAAAAAAPTGTTGADGNLNFFARNNANILYVENRLGAAISFMPTYLSLANGELVL